MIGCAIGPPKKTASVKSLLREGISKERVGVALAGGSKAAPYAMGVLAAIADSEKGLMT
jgi:hypothetical protein